MNRDFFLEEASRIGNLLLDNRVATKLGNQTWLIPNGYGTEANPLRISKAGVHLYDGVAGIALFLATLGHASGSPRFESASLEAILPLRQLLQRIIKNRSSAELNIPPGGLIGLGSIIYALLKIGDLLDSPTLASEAHELSELLTADELSKDHRVRIQTGAAGALLAILALQEKIPEPNRNGHTPLEIANKCARRLVGARRSFEGLPAAWPLSPGKPPLIGFSYGAAGISYALLRLHKVQPNPEYLAAAEDGLRFVAAFFTPELGCWKDVRQSFEMSHELLSGTWKDWWANGTSAQLKPRPNLASAASPSNRDLYSAIWCHGAPGIALGRLGTLDVQDSPEIRQEIEGALRFTETRIREAEAAGGGPDDLCCGRMGQIDVFLEAGRLLQAPQWQELAEDFAEAAVLQARERGRYVLSAARGTDVFSPALFQGLAGVGYTLLRLIDPDNLPCILRLS